MSMTTSFLIVSETASQFIEIQQTPSSGDESNVDNTLYQSRIDLLALTGSKTNKYCLLSRMFTSLNKKNSLRYQLSL